MQLKNLKNLVQKNKVTKKQLVEYVKNKYNTNLNKYKKADVITYFKATQMTKKDLGKQLNIRKVKYVSRDKKMTLVNKLFNKSIEKAQEKVKEDKIKKEVDNGVKHEYEITINYENLYKPYTIAIHNQEVIKAHKAYPNSIYVQTAYFFYKKFNKDSKHITDEYIENKDSRRSVLLTQVNKKTKKYLTDRFLRNSGWIIEEFVLGLDLDEGDDIHDPKVILKTTVYKQVKANKDDYLKMIYEQQFKKSISNTCVYDGLINYANNKKDTDRNMKAIYNKLANNKDKYAKAYTYEDLRELSSDLKISITIQDLVNGNDLLISSPMSRHNIKFINTRFNHLDLYLGNNEIEYVSTNEYLEQKEKAKYYVESFGTLYFIDKTIKIEVDEFKIKYNEWANEYDIINKSILHDSDMNKFLDTYDFSMFRTINDIKDKKFNELDIRKAYYNYDKTKYYKGLPSGSFLLYKCDDKFEYSKLDNMVGFFNVSILKSNYEFEKLGFITNKNYTLFSCEIDILIDYGIEFKFNYAMISPRFNAPFGNNMLEKTDNGTSFYSKAIGYLLINDNNIITNIKAEDVKHDFINLISNKNKTTYVNKDHIILVEKNEHAMTNRHIGFAVHAYTKSLIMRKILEIGTDNVFMVRLDSIVHINNGKNYDDEQFKTKKIDIERYENIKYEDNEDNDLDYGLDMTAINRKDYLCDIYEDENLDTLPLYVDNNEHMNYIDDIFTPTNEYIYKRLNFLGGKGGSGKTYSILNTKNMSTKNICFTTHCWNLISEQKQKYPIHGLSLHKLLGYIGDAKYEKHNLKSIRYIVIDEATLIDVDTINNIIRDYPHLFIFVLGDIDKDGFYYQCSCQNQVISNFDKFQYIPYTKTYRFDDKLNEKLDHLRLFMKNNPNDILQLQRYIKNNWADNIMDIDDIIYNDNDIGISSLNELNEKNNSGISNYFINKNAKPKYWIKKTNYERGQFRGQYLGNILPEHKNYEMTLFKTIHSYQGCQLPDDKTIKMIVCIDSLFDFNLFFTALSRARNVNQIVMFFKRINKTI